MMEVFQRIVDQKHEEEKEEQKILITARKMKSYYKELLSKDISTPTIREYGLSPDGIFLIRHPKVFDYRETKKNGIPQGMVVDVDKFIEEIGLPEEENDEED